MPGSARSSAMSRDGRAVRTHHRIARTMISGGDRSPANAEMGAGSAMPTIDRGDLTLYYAERGDSSGPPVVLLHGLTMSSRTMERLADSLDDHRVLLLDLHGHGKSTTLREPERYLIGEFADDVVALLDHLEIDRAVIGGLSLGANVSYEVALRHPERVRALVLEMPVFARGVPAGRVFFSALSALFTALWPVLTPWHPVIRLSLIHISEPTRRTPISYAVFCLK